MLSDKVDATLGAFWNYEGEDLERRGRDPQILRMEKLGVPTYDELVMVVRRKDLDEGFSSKLRRFLRATARGHQRLRENPETGVDALLKVDPGLERGLQTAVVSATLPVFFPSEGQAVRLAGAGRVGRLRRLDVRERAAQEATGRGTGADQRVPAGRGAGPADDRRSVSRPAPAAMIRYVPARPFHSP